jgi:hypothetical protein
MNLQAFNDRYLLNQAWDSWVWMLKGRRLPPPGALKQRIIARFAERYGLKSMIETGTHYGDMVAAMRTRFNRIDSIEIYEPLYIKALARFAGDKNIYLHYGDSEKILPAILAALTEPALFWLDAHYSGEGTGKGSLDTPILKELKFILAHPLRKHVILIDDARLFVGRDGYPSLEDLRDFLDRQSPERQFAVHDDIIRIHPSESWG